MTSWTCIKLKQDTHLCRAQQDDHDHALELKSWLEIMIKGLLVELGYFT